MKNRILAGVSLALIALTIWGVWDAPPLFQWRWECTREDGWRGSFDLPPDRVTQTPEGWVIDTEHLGVLPADHCEGHQR